MAETLAVCDDREPVRTCSAPNVGGCSIRGLGASGGLERLQPIACIHCQFHREPCLGCSWGGPGAMSPMPRCFADEVSRG